MEGLIGVFLGSLITYLIFRTERKDKFNLAAKEREDKYKLVAVKKRLEAHQGIFQHWYNLMLDLKTDSSDERLALAIKAWDFWRDNCLYLENKTRSLFPDMITLFELAPMKYKDFRSLPSGKNKDDELKLLTKEYETFYHFGDIVLEEVELNRLSNYPIYGKKHISDKIV